MARLHRGPLQILIAEIVDEEIPDGDALPREVDLAKRFEVSRGTVRECIRGLEERGLIRVTHGRGATVNPPENWDTLDADVLASLLAGKRSASVLGDFLECRRILEIEAAGLAAARSTPEDVARLTEAFERMQATAGRAAANPAAEALFHQADAAFHRALFRTTKNSSLVALASKIHAAMIAARVPLARPEDRTARALPEHQRILRAVAKGDPRAARKAMEEHLATVGTYLADYSARRTSHPHPVPAEVVPN